MKFKKNTRRPPIEYEKDLVRYWKDNQTFEKSVKMRPKEKAWVFYDGPPFLTGTPHHGHLLVSSIKDTMARFHTMLGQRVERVWGWDCHGLPAEVFVEKQLGIESKKEIGTKISVLDYVKACRQAMVKTGTEWEDTIDRIGRWVEFKGAYKTMDKDYMESVWWAFKTLYEKGKIYEGEKVLVYCTKDATPISKSEVAMENSYRKDVDPSVFVYFKLENSSKYLLAWTTTPWTLPANVALAVNSQENYSLVEYQDRQFYVATSALDRVMQDEKHQPLEYSVIEKIKGDALVGEKYHPLFENRGPKAHVVLNADFVTTEEGTGIVHQAPAYGEDDYTLCKNNNVPVISMVDENGNYTEGRWLGKNIWEVNKEIAKTLLSEGCALKVEYVEHEYPHCHRCGTKLMYRSHPSWFMDIDGQRDEMLEASSKTNWTPKNLRDGRFRNIIETAPDWNLSRDRYWATPIPVWKGQRDGIEVVKVFGDYREFSKLTGKDLDDYHLPQVMDIEFELDGVVMKHVGKVLDCWFESGSMPFAQFHYPFENKQKFEDSFPADFIIEAVDQTRGWFYNLLAINVGLFGEAPWRNLICTGFVNASDGKKMSKKLSNYTDPMELMDKYSADSFRFLMMNSPLSNGENFALNDRFVGDISRKLAMVWNMYDFFTTYAEVDDWEFDGIIKDPSPDCNNTLDIWILSRLHQLLEHVTDSMKEYDLPAAMRPILEFIDEASNWYIRRSRRRFWKSENSQDKQMAYKTLHYVLVTLSRILAPFTPFIAEELYQKLTGEESVHLTDWPVSGDINGSIVTDMSIVMNVVNEGLSQRAKAGIKTRQPLAKVRVSSRFPLSEELKQIAADELNVKSVDFITTKNDNITVVLDTKITKELKKEGLAREIIRYIQNARKDAGFEVDDRINLSIFNTDTEIETVISDYRRIIESETLATITDKKGKLGYTKQATIDSHEVSLAISKAR